MQQKTIQFRSELLPSATSGLVQSLGLDTDSWSIQGSQCKQVGELLHYAETVTVELIALKAQLPSEVLRSSITFTHLVFLELDSSGLLSIQFLKDLRAPLLENLSLESNLITSIRPLRKSRLPNLSRLKLNRNPIQDCSALVQFFGISQNFTLVLEDEFISNDQDLTAPLQPKTSTSSSKCRPHLQRYVHFPSASLRERAKNIGAYLADVADAAENSEWRQGSPLQVPHLWSNVSVS